MNKNNTAEPKQFRLQSEPISKREYFAAMAMQGWLASWPSDSWLQDHEKLAEVSVQIADALINELQK